MKTTVGCKALNQIHTHQSTHTDALDKNVSFTIEKGSWSNLLPVTEDVKKQIIDFFVINKNCIPISKFWIWSNWWKIFIFFKVIGF